MRIPDGLEVGEGEVSVRVHTRADREGTGDSRKGGRKVGSVLRGGLLEAH